MVTGFLLHLRPRLRAWILVGGGIFFSIFPLRLGFGMAVLAEAAHLPGRRMLSLAFQGSVARRLWRHRNSRLSSSLTDRWALQAVHVLNQIGAFDEAIAVAERAGSAAVSMDLSALHAKALFEMARFEEAKRILDGWSRTAGARYGYEICQLKGELALLFGHEDEGVRLFREAAVGGKHLMWPLQNLAARYSGTYTLNRVDTAAGDQGRLFDGYNYIGQRVTHVGAGDLGPGLFAKALHIQKTLSRKFPPLSAPLRDLLAKLDIPVQDLRVIPAEWFTQIGHQAVMLDILFRMRRLNWWNGRAIMLPNPKLIANQAMLSLYEQEGPILLPGFDIDAAVTGELLSLQRYCGLSFNAFEWPDGSVVPWQDAGARLMQQWEQEKRDLPLQKAFDFKIGGDTPTRESIDRIMRAWGIQPGDWYVTLHMRDASHYGETSGFGQSHRNAEVENYLAAIEYVTRLGGWVIKLGGPASPKLPPMERVVDYARSAFKSEMMDLWLIRHARFFIGTTSGLTNVAISFGIPSALVNCITVDAQLWHSSVRFALKPIRTSDGRLLSQREITSSPWRWRLFSAETLLHQGAIALENSSDEIAETVKEVAELAAHGGSPVNRDASSNLIETWSSNLAFDYFYGAALPSTYYLKKYETEFLCHAEYNNKRKQVSPAEA